MHAAQVRARAHASKLVTTNKLEHACEVIEHAIFNKVHEKKKALTRDLVLASMKLEMSCTVTYFSYS